MFRLLLFFSILTFLYTPANAQVPDFIALKKRNGATVRNFYAGGWPISFITTDGRRYEGPIAKIQNDSLYVRFYQVNKLQTIWNTFIYDTVNIYTVPFHYKEIKQIILPTVRKRKGYLGTLATMMQMGGFGYGVVNAVNSIYLKDPFTSKRNLTNVGIATAAAFGGIIIKRQYADVRRNTRKHRIVYVNMQ